MLRRLALGALWLWRCTLGAVLPDACRFTPSCSHYAAEAVATRGLLKGGALAVWRILRCNPFSRGGYDPVVRTRPPCRPGSHAAAGGQGTERRTNDG